MYQIYGVAWSAYTYFYPVYIDVTRGERAHHGMIARRILYFLSCRVYHLRRVPRGAMGGRQLARSESIHAKGKFAQAWTRVVAAVYHDALQETLVPQSDRVFIV